MMVGAYDFKEVENFEMGKTTRACDGILAPKFFKRLDG